MQHLSPQELRDHLASTKEPPLLLDVREPWEFEICRIGGSVLIPMREVPSALQRLDPGRETVIICHHGIRSRQVGLFLEHRGFRSIINLIGGVAGWAREVDSQMPTY